ncbi:hypothetical protein [Maricaulis sp.]|uniref:hypothetical protein n=1 Tax=Maricaulis sp. TaxID=1486257 RepID=UPI003A8DACBC
MAALIGTLAQSLLTAAFPETLETGIMDSDSLPVAGTAARFANLVAAAFVFLAMLGSLIWFVAFRLAGSVARKLGLAGYAALGASVVFLMVVGWMMMTITPLLTGLGISLASDVGRSALVQWLVGVGLPWAIAGAIWGTVFWLRAPKPQTAGIAA